MCIRLYKTVAIIKILNILSKEPKCYIKVLLGSFLCFIVKLGKFVLVGHTENIVTIKWNVDFTFAFCLRTDIEQKFMYCGVS